MLTKYIEVLKVLFNTYLKVGLPYGPLLGI